MKRIVPFRRTRIVISIALGVIAFAFVGIGVWYESHSEGDTPERIKEAKDSLEQIRQFAISNTTSEEEKLWVLLLSTNGMNRDNSLIFQGKALAYLKEKPEICDRWVWDERFDWAKDAFHVGPPTSELAWRSIRFGLLASAIITPVSWLALLVVSWLAMLVWPRLRDGYKFSNLGVKRLFIVGLVAVPLFVGVVFNLREHKAGDYDFSFPGFLAFAFVTLPAYLVAVRIALWVHDGFAATHRAQNGAPPNVAASPEPARNQQTPKPPLKQSPMKKMLIRFGLGMGFFVVLRLLATAAHVDERVGNGICGILTAVFITAVYYYQKRQ
ncbi:MAG: hypothetical protein ACLPT4_01155 [Verrucomicrobiia bacterium]